MTNVNTVYTVDSVTQIDPLYCTKLCRVCYLASLAYACEDTQLSIDCGSGKLIYVINANFGRLGDELCPNNIGEANNECVAAGSRDIVYSA